jgi:hypothetical protein
MISDQLIICWPISSFDIACGLRRTLTFQYGKRPPVITGSCSACHITLLTIRCLVFLAFIFWLIFAWMCSWRSWCLPILCFACHILCIHSRKCSTRRLLKYKWLLSEFPVILIIDFNRLGVRPNSLHLMHLLRSILFF